MYVVVFSLVSMDLNVIYNVYIIHCTCTYTWYIENENWLAIVMMIISTIPIFKAGYLKCGCFIRFVLCVFAPFGGGVLGLGFLFPHL